MAVLAAAAASATVWAEAPSPSVLGAAVQRNDVEAVKAYVAAGGDVDAAGCRALYQAYRRQQFDLVRYLESQGAHVNPNLLQMHYLSVRQDLITLRSALETHRLQTQRYPSAAEFKAAVAQVLGSDTPKDMTQDFWGRPVVYRLDAGVPTLISLGADGMPGGRLFARDIAADDTLEALEAAANEADPAGRCTR